MAVRNVKSSQKSPHRNGIKREVPQEKASDNLLTENTEKDKEVNKAEEYPVKQIG